MADMREKGKKEKIFGGVRLKAFGLLTWSHKNHEEQESDFTK